MEKSMLPKITHPTFEVNIPSQNKKVKMRMMLVREEKILLMAKESDSQADVMNSIKQVVNNCLVGDVDVNKLTVVDLEYLFLKLRAMSVDSSTKVSYRDNEDNKVYDFEVDLSQIQVKFPENTQDLISITDKISLKLKYPEASIYEDKDIFSESTETEDLLDRLLYKCIDKIFDGDNVIQIKDISMQELKDFMDDIDIKSYQNIREFLTKVPSIYHEIEYENEYGNKRKIVMNTLSDFFTLR
jgi:hypothetical protein